jgi:hypothetical protein
LISYVLFADFVAAAHLETRLKLTEEIQPLFYQFKELGTADSREGPPEEDI